MRQTLQKYFEKYSRNLSAVNKHPKVQIEPDLPNIFLCPQCIKRGYLFEEVREQSLTLEHVPPKSMGGSIRTITCFNCNSSSGSDLDSHLLHYIQLKNFADGVVGSFVDARVALGEEQIVGNQEMKSSNNFEQNNTFVSAEVEITQKGFSISISDERSNPELLHDFKSALDEKSFITIKTHGRSGRISNKRRVDAALLRIAYLYAFSVFGYGFLINNDLQVVRHQFTNPDKQILPPTGIYENLGIPNQNLGINVVTEPSDLRSFLVVFDLAVDGYSRRFSVFLPGHGTPSGQIYENLGTTYKSGFTFSLVKIPEFDAYLTDPKEAFASHFMWKYLNGAKN